MILQGSVKVLVKPANPEIAIEEIKQEGISALHNQRNSNRKSKWDLEPINPSSPLKLRHCISSVLAANRQTVFRSSLTKVFQTPLISGNNDSYSFISDENRISELIEVNTLNTGASFGELALLSNKPRAATIICKEDCHFAVLEKDDFRRILKSAEEKKLLEEMNFFASLYIFKNWNFNLVKMLYVNTQTKSFRLNEFVYEEDEESEGVYILQNGTFIVTKRLVLQNTSNINKWGKLKDLYADDSKYIHKETIQVKKAKY